MVCFSLVITHSVMGHTATFTHLLLFSLFFTTSIGSTVLNDDIATIRERVLELMIWPAPPSIPSVTSAALQFASTLNSSCYWPDINYHDQSIVLWKTATHMYRITTMLQAL